MQDERRTDALRSADDRALVIGGGGVAGIAWATGVLAGLADAEVTDPVERLRRMGEMALAAETVIEAERRSVIEARLPSSRWPGRNLSVVAVDAGTGETRVFDRGSGVGLVDAVTASCALPGVWPPATIGDARYFDGGFRSFTNLDLAAGHARTLAIAPMPDPVLHADAVSIAEHGNRVEVITPDRAAVAAFGADPMFPASRAPAGRAGFAQGQPTAGAVGALWTKAHRSATVSWPG